MSPGFFNGFQFPFFLSSIRQTEKHLLKPEPQPACFLYQTLLKSSFDS